MRIMPEWGGENYEGLYGDADYKDKDVLDIGADWGSTAYWLLGRGAKYILAVEIDPQLYRALVHNLEQDNLIGRIDPQLGVSDSGSLEEILAGHNFDIAKIDCEGCEELLIDVSDEVFSRVKEYVIETHSDDIYDQIARKLAKNSYEIIREQGSGVKVIHACKKEVN